MSDGYEELKQCIGRKYFCGKFKPLSEFDFRLDTGKYRGQCRDCRNKYFKDYDTKRAKTPERIEYRKDHYNDNKVDILEKKHQYYIKNIDIIKEKKKKYCEENKEIIKEKKKQYYEENKEDILEYHKDYRINNKDKCRKSENESKRKRRKNDPKWALRKDVSGDIGQKLKNIGKSKDGESSSKYFPWTDQEFFAHIELLFSHPDNLTIDGKVWMTWQNRGKYDPKTWDDNDPSTWTWQLDHIIPHSEFDYETMDCQEFRDCWALSNLRPLSAKRNFLDGFNKIRHKGMTK